MRSAATPSDASFPTAREPARRWWRSATLWSLAAAGYWGALFAATHTPTAQLPGAALDIDKLLHGGSYAVLATALLVVWRRAGGAPTWRGRLLVAAVTLAYGAIDELTQPYFGRECSAMDWVADAIGVFGAIAVDQWRHPRR